MNVKTYGLFPAKNKEKFIGDLKRNGAEVVLFPDYKVEKINLDATFFVDLRHFDWLIFTDVFAADIFLEISKENAFDHYELDDFRIFAAGEAVADRLRFEQIHSDIIPANLAPEIMFRAISDYEANLSNLKFLVLKESETKIELTEILRKSEVEVLETPIYKIVFAGETARIKALIKGGAIDKIVFASPGEINAFEKIFEGEVFSEVLSETEVSATDDVTRKLLWEKGLK